jgi:NitT/TauT family transport system permease protein
MTTRAVGVIRRRLIRIVPPLVVAVVLVGSWEVFVNVRDIEPFLLPKPSLIWDQFWAFDDKIWEATKVSGANALVGLIIGLALGMAMALVASRFRVFRGMVVPVAAALNTMPIIALAPMFNNMFSSTSAIPRRLVVTIVVFFPVFLNVLKGLTQVEATHVELMRSYASTDTDVLRKLRLPNALPFLFTSLKIAASLAVIAAVVAEYFGGVQTGLGSRITSAVANSANGRAWAYVVAACALGLAFYVGSLGLERLVMPWQAKRRAAS